MINYEETLKRLRANHRNRLKNDIGALCAAKKIDEKILPLLPEGWKTEFSHWFATYHITKEEPASSAEFKLICKLIEKITGAELEKTLEGDEKHQWLRVWQCIYIDNVSLILIISQDNPTNCQFEIKEKIVKKLIPIDGKCLGLVNQE